MDDLTFSTGIGPLYASLVLAAGLSVLVTLTIAGWGLRAVKTHEDGPDD